MSAKVIFIHNVVYPYTKDFPPPDSDNYFNFGLGRLMFDNMHRLELKPQMAFENWRMDIGVSKIRERTVGRVKCRIFPARKYSRLGIFSFRFLWALRNECRKNQVVIHTSNPHKFFFLFMAVFLRNYPIMTTHLGGSNPLYKFRIQRKRLSYLTYLAERFAQKWVDRFFVSVIAEKRYFEKIVPGEKIIFGPIQGVEKDFTDSSGIQKIAARKKLGIPQNHKVMLTVGRLTQGMGADETIRVFKRLKTEFPLSWLAVGVAETNEFYHQAREAGASLFGYINRYDGLVDFYAAADVYCCPRYHYPESEQFAGTGIAVLEALFMNVPVVGNGLTHIPDGEGCKCGIIPADSEEFYLGIKMLFTGRHRFENTRSIVQKYYTWDKVLTKYMGTWQEILQKYSCLNKK